MLVYCHIKNVKKRCNKHQILIRLQSLRTDINKFFCVVLLCVFTFWVPLCDVRYDFCIKTMFGLSLPVVCRRVHVLFTLYCLLAHSGVQHILCCVFVLFFFVLCINITCMKKKNPHKSNKTPAIIWKLHKNNISIYMYIFTYWY